MKGVVIFFPLAGPHKRNGCSENCPVTHCCVLKDSDKEKYYFYLNHLSIHINDTSSAQEISISEYKRLPSVKLHRSFFVFI